MKDPIKIIWGLHIHQDVPDSIFPQALVQRELLIAFLQKSNIAFDSADAFNAGYGAHLHPMWEIHIKTLKENLLEKLGKIIGYLSVNQHPNPMYLHPLMHDNNLPEVELIKQEGETNQKNTLWFGKRVDQYHEFFDNPPLDKQGNVIDTRNPNKLSQNIINLKLNEGKKALPNFQDKDPFKKIIQGFHIHMDIPEAHISKANHIFDELMCYLLEHEIRPTSTRLYGPRENGPHINGGWEIKFERRDESPFEHIGIVVGWLMVNRGDLPVFMHPVTWEEGDSEEEIKAHQKYSFFLGNETDLDLSFFDGK